MLHEFNTPVTKLKHQYIVLFFSCRGSALQRRRREREMEVEADERDRQREMEEIEEIRKQIVDTQSEEIDEQVCCRAHKFIQILTIFTLIQT